LSQTLTGRIREFGERCAAPLPWLADKVEALALRVDEHLRKMDFAWN
jgi:type I restriction enzyme M protein